MDASSIPSSLLTPPFSFLSPRARPTLLTTLSSSSIPWSRKHTGASAIRDVQSDALYFLLPNPTPMLSSSRPLDHLSLLTPPLWSSIPQARHSNAAAFVVVPESPIPQIHHISLVYRRQLRCHHQFRGPVSEVLLTLGLLTSYFF